MPPMSTVLRKLQREVFVLSLGEPLSKVPELPGFESYLNDPCELEVAIDSGHDLNGLFAMLSDRDISVVSLRNKANRLEELFMGIVENKKNNAASSV